MQGQNVVDGGGAGPADVALRDEALREFFLVLRDALLMVVRFIERRYMRR